MPLRLPMPSQHPPFSRRFELSLMAITAGLKQGQQSRFPHEEAEPASIVSRRPEIPQ